jgi:hypothetical protein
MIFQENLTLAGEKVAVAEVDLCEVATDEEDPCRGKLIPLGKSTVKVQSNMNVHSAYSIDESPVRVGLVNCPP